MSLTRQQLVQWLNKKNISFFRTASVVHLRRLRKSEIERLGIELSDSETTTSETMAENQPPNSPPSDLLPPNMPADNIQQPNIPAVNIQQSAVSDGDVQQQNIPASVIQQPIIPPGNEPPNGNLAALAAEEAILDAALRVEEKRARLNALRAELARDMPEERRFQPRFKDIEHSVLIFAGSEEYDATKWLSDFERACDSVNGDDVFRLKCIR